MCNRMYSHGLGVVHELAFIDADEPSKYFSFTNKVRGDQDVFSFPAVSYLARKMIDECVVGKGGRSGQLRDFSKIDSLMISILFMPLATTQAL